MDKLFKLSDFKNKVFAKVVGKQENIEMLKTIPYTNVCNNLAVTYRYLLSISEDGMTSALVTKDMMYEEGLTREELHECAMKNTKDMFPLKAAEMQDILKELEEPVIVPDGMDIKLVVLTNERQINGVISIAYPDFLQDVSKNFFEGGNFKILPSSVHEVIAVPDSMETDAMLDLVGEANSSVVEERDILSDAVYQYDAVNKKVECIAANVKITPPNLSL